jgi:hypothetical protein
MNFITYGNGPYKGHANRLAFSAIKRGGFATSRVYDESHFTAGFKTTHHDVLQLSHGFGAWCWKSYCILKRLDELADGDILAYCDSLYLFKRDIRQTAQDWLKDREMVIFENKPSEPSFLEKIWAKYDAFHLLGADPKVHGETQQSWSGFVMLRKSPQTVAFIREWYDKCADTRLMNDEPSVFGEELPEFIQGRKDQTIISILSKVKNIGYPFLRFPADLLYNIRIGT